MKMKKKKKVSTWLGICGLTLFVFLLYRFWSQEDHRNEAIMSISDEEAREMESVGGAILLQYMQLAEECAREVGYLIRDAYDNKKVAEFKVSTSSSMFNNRILPEIWLQKLTEKLKR